MKRIEHFDQRSLRLRRPASMPGRASWTSVAAAAVVMTVGLAAGQANAQTKACVITQTGADPFSAKILSTAAEVGQSQGIEVRTFPGVSGDAATQVVAIEQCISGGANGLMIDASDPAAIAPVLNRAREAGLFVVALGTSVANDAADVTIGTNGRLAGEAAATWVREVSRAKNGRIGAMLIDEALAQGPADDNVAKGFLEGFAISTDPGALPMAEQSLFDSVAPRAFKFSDGDAAIQIAGSSNTTINAIVSSPGAEFVDIAEGLRAQGLDREVPVVALRAGCNDIDQLAQLDISAAVVELPDRMAKTGLEAIDQFARNGTRPSAPNGGNILDVGGALVLGNGPEVQIPVPTCLVNPQFCKIEVIRFEQASDVCR